MNAILSDCRRYRYRLDRELESATGKTIAFFGINPSTADERTDDPTLRKMMGFASRNGASSVVVGNVFAFRTPHVHELELMNDPVGPDNQEFHKQIIQDADVLVPCWGGRSKVPASLHRHFDELLSLLNGAGKPVHCLGLTVNGDPKHPLFLSYSTELIRM